MAKSEKIKPVVINRETGESFTLEFNRESVKIAENEGFSIENLSNGRYLNAVSDLFFFSFHMHHPFVTREEADRILFDEMGGASQGLIERLGQLYVLPYNTLVQTEESAKNSKWTVVL